MNFTGVFSKQESEPCPHIKDLPPRGDSHDKDSHKKKKHHDKKDHHDQKHHHDKKNHHDNKDHHDKKAFFHDNKEFFHRMKDFHAKKEACLRETNADHKDVKRAFREGVFAEDQSLKCFFRCMLQKKGAMNSAGVIDIEAFRAQLPPFVDEAKARVALEKCKNASGSNPCETAFEFEKCMRKEMGPPKRFRPHPEEKK